jgi:hypothetical protein
MIVLSKGWKLPETGDFGDVWFQALEDNINQSNGHKHDGIDSEKISSVSMVSTVATVAAGSFSLISTGIYRSLVVIPSGALLDTLAVTVKDPVTKDQIFLRLEKVSPTTFYIYTNFVQDFEVYFGV